MHIQYDNTHYFVYLLLIKLWYNIYVEKDINWGEIDMNKTLHVGLDVGSTTVKIVVMNDKLENLYTSYTRHQ